MTEPLKIKARDSCRWDLVSLGEIMVRFDPGEKRIATTRSFEVCEGGGEYNVARGLKRCFGLDTAVVTGGGRHYLIAAMTHHPKGDDYLIEFAAAVDDLLKP